MAKPGEVGALEGHVEKAVVAVSFLLMLYSLFHWAWSSPRRVPLQTGGVEQEVRPDEVDPKLLDSARRLWEKVKEADPHPMALPDYAKVMEGLRLSPSIPGGIHDFSTPRYPMKVTTEPNEKRLAVDKLRELIPAPGAPEVWADRELLRQDTPTDVVAAHGVGIYPYADLARVWSQTVGRVLPLSLVFLGVEVEIREIGPDGRPGEPRPVSVIGIDAQGKSVSIPPVSSWKPGENPDKTRGDVTTLANTAWQQQILQPEFWDIWWPSRKWGTWRIHLPRNEVIRAAEVLPAGPGMPPAGPAPRGPMPPTYRPTPPPSIPRVGPRAGPRWPGMEPPPEEAYPPEMMETGVTGPMPPTMPPVEGVQDPNVPIVPLIVDQMRDGKVLVWFHDTALQPLKTYQYRLRLRLLNPLYTQERQAQNPQDAAVLALVSPYSNWSKPFSVPQATQFFLRGYNAHDRTVRVDVFARGLGQTVAGDFTARVGSSIGQKVEMLVANPATLQSVAVPVDFRTGAIVVGIEFNKVVQTLTFPKRTVELLYLDQAGELRTRTLAEDEASKTREALRKEAQQAKAAAAATVTPARP